MDDGEEYKLFPHLSFVCGWKSLFSLNERIVNVNYLTVPHSKKKLFSVAIYWKSILQVSTLQIKILFILKHLGILK